MNEESLQSEPRRQEQVFSHNIDSSSEHEPLRMARLELRMQANTNDFKVEIPEYEGKLDPEDFLDWLHTVERVFEYKYAKNMPFLRYFYTYFMLVIIVFLRFLFDFILFCRF